MLKFNLFIQEKSGDFVDWEIQDFGVLGSPGI
jgi:hypothetical protein